jgi:nucleoid-associated protein YgaU
MTRENKVALVVGSDAQTRRSADLAPPAARTAATAGRAGARLLDLQSPARPRPDEVAPAAVPVPVPAPTARSEPEAPAPEPSPPLPEARFHDVQPGESLSEICHRYYGDVSLTQELADVNGIDDPDDLRAGHRLRLPPLGEAAPGQESVTRPDAPLGGGPTYGSYRVKPGDSLSGIARRFLHTADRWRQLYELNRDVIADPDDIRVGTVIRIPAEAGR